MNVRAGNPSHKALACVATGNAWSQDVAEALATESVGQGASARRALYRVQMLLGRLRGAGLVGRRSDKAGYGREWYLTSEGERTLAGLGTETTLAELVREEFGGAATEPGVVKLIAPFRVLVVDCQVTGHLRLGVREAEEVLRRVGAEVPRQRRAQERALLAGFFRRRFHSAKTSSSGRSTFGVTCQMAAEASRRWVVATCDKHAGRRSKTLRVSGRAVSTRTSADSWQVP